MIGENKSTCLDMLCLKLSFILCIALYLFSYVLGGEYKTCDDVGTFQHYIDFSWRKCSDECARRQRCKIFMFRKEMNYCTLKDNIDIKSLDKTCPICAYFERDENIPVDIGPCRGQPCDETERCNSKTKTEYECLKTECLAPKQIESAKLLSNIYSIGSTHRYKCTNGLVGRGSASIVCLNNGTWSKTNFKCMLPPMACPELKPTYTNSILTNVDNIGYIGTVLTYTCRNGYNKHAKKVTVTCQKSGKWSLERSSCCHDNSTVLGDGSCLTVVNGGLISSRQEAINYCKSVGGTLAWASWNYKYLFNKTITRFVLNSNLKSFMDTLLRYDECAAENGDVADYTLTYDEKIAEIREKMWIGSACIWGYRFSPGQPDGGDAEQCLVRDLQQHYTHWDMPCTFQEKDVGFMCSYHIPKMEP
ncbi:Complement component 4 binding protein [Mactra antiquata]